MFERAINAAVTTPSPLMTDCSLTRWDIVGHAGTSGHEASKLGITKDCAHSGSSSRWHGNHLPSLAYYEDEGVVDRPVSYRPN